MTHVITGSCPLGVNPSHVHGGYTYLHTYSLSLYKFDTASKDTLFLLFICTVAYLYIYHSVENKRSQKGKKMWRTKYVRDFPDEIKTKQIYYPI